MVVGFERATRRKRFRVDGVVVPRQTDAVGSVPSVMFSPADVALIAGEPSVRRRYIDVVLALTSRSYLRSLMLYRGALMRRNAVLRDVQRTGSSRADESLVAAWEPALAEHGAALTAARRQWIADIAARFTTLCDAFGESQAAALRYAASFEDDGVDAAMRALEERRAGDMRRGATHVGPHRDSLGILIDGRELRGFGSAGQQRTASIALRVIEAETYRERAGAAPLFLLDDPFAALDATRAHRILELLSAAGPGQTILAVPRAADIPAEFVGLERMSVRDGSVTPHAA
jgi:DNA replication and repair protein RecF